MQGLNPLDGKQALAALDHSKLKGLKQGLKAAGKEFNLDELSPVQLEKAAREGEASHEQAAGMFEDYFATSLVKEMRQSLKSGFFEGAGSDVYSAWFDEHLGAALRQGDGLGIGKMIREALSPRDLTKAFKDEGLGRSPQAADKENKTP